jgi:hypothetical protein
VSGRERVQEVSCDGYVEVLRMKKLSALIMVCFISAGCVVSDTPATPCNEGETGLLSAATNNGNDSLSRESELRIKQDWVNHHNDSFNIDDVQIYQYLGTYNGSVVIVINANPTQALSKWNFYESVFYIQSGFPIHVWNNGTFYEITTAYTESLLTKQDVENIFADYPKISSNLKTD